MTSFFADPRVQLAGGMVIATALFVWVVRRVVNRIADRLRPSGDPNDLHLRRELLRTAIAPLTLLLWYYSLWALANAANRQGWFTPDWARLDGMLWRAVSVGLVAAGVWFLWRVTHVIDRWLRDVAGRTRTRIDDIVLPLVGTALRVLVPVVALFLFTRLLPLSPVMLSFINKMLSISLIVALTWVLRRGILLLDSAVLGPRTPTTLADRALFTRVRVLRKIGLTLITVFAVAAVLMTFEEVRDVGRSLLASAGIAGIVLGFAAQRSLGNLFAGLQIALTQPVRIGDQVLVEGDVGNIEEITLTYVVVRVWDQRRIVLPISYFIEKPFQNWTRVATNMLSPLTLRMDFSLPVSELRSYLQKEIARSPNWDQQVFGVQVTNSDSNSMEVRVLASAPDSGASFNLQCELREKAIEFVRENYPQSLPKQRREQ